MAKAKFEHPAFPKGEVFGIDGVGEVVNGEEFEVTDEMDKDALMANPHISMHGKAKAKTAEEVTAEAEAEEEAEEDEEGGEEN